MDQATKQSNQVTYAFLSSAEISAANTNLRTQKPVNARELFGKVCLLIASSSIIVDIFHYKNKLKNKNIKWKTNYLNNMLNFVIYISFFLMTNFSYGFEYKNLKNNLTNMIKSIENSASIAFDAYVLS